MFDGASNSIVYKLAGSLTLSGGVILKQNPWSTHFDDD
jgi:hypothetical protein